MIELEKKEKEMIQALFTDFLREQPLSVVLSGQAGKDDFIRMRLRPVLSAGQVAFQAEEFRGKQAFHKNMDASQACAYLTELMGTAFKQAQAETEGWTASVLVSKKGKISIKRKPKAEIRKPADVLNDAWKSGLAHNRKKNYILEEGKAVPFLVDLGVMTKDGKIVNSRYDKFRQINRFLEFIEDILPKLDRSRESVILDFGCGKSYLTFAMYYYLKELKGYPVRIIGLDLKKDVIEKDVYKRQVFSTAWTDFELTAEKTGAGAKGGWMIPALAGGALLAAAVLVFLFVKKKKRALPEENGDHQKAVQEAEKDSPLK